MPELPDIVTYITAPESRILGHQLVPHSLGGVGSPLTASSGLTRVVFLRRLKLNLLPHRLNLPPLPFAPADQIANEKTLQDWNQRHRENKKESGEPAEALCIANKHTTLRPMANPGDLPSIRQEAGVRNTKGSAQKLLNQTDARCGNKICPEKRKMVGNPESRRPAGWSSLRRMAGDNAFY
jgi:hypothetical protein